MRVRVPSLTAVRTTGWFCSWLLPSSLSLGSLAVGPSAVNSAARVDAPVRRADNGERGVDDVFEPVERQRVRDLGRPAADTGNAEATHARRVTRRPLRPVILVCIDASKEICWPAGHVVVSEAGGGVGVVVEPSAIEVDVCRVGRFVRVPPNEPDLISRGVEIIEQVRCGRKVGRGARRRRIDMSPVVLTACSAEGDQHPLRVRLRGDVVSLASREPRVRRLTSNAWHLPERTPIGRRRRETRIVVESVAFVDGCLGRLIELEDGWRRAGRLSISFDTAFAIGWDCFDAQRLDHLIRCSGISSTRSTGRCGGHQHDAHAVEQ